VSTLAGPKATQSPMNLQGIRKMYRFCTAEH